MAIRDPKTFNLVMHIFKSDKYIEAEKEIWLRPLFRLLVVFLEKKKKEKRSYRAEIHNFLNIVFIRCLASNSRCPTSVPKYKLVLIIRTS